MYLNDRIAFIGGLAMVLLAVTTVISVALTATSTGDGDPFDEDKVAEFLTDVAENKDMVMATAGISILNDGVFALTVAATAFLLFRDRSALLATLTLVGIVAGATLSLTNDLVTIMLAVVAEDFVEGGPQGVAAGDPATLELGRVLGMISFAMANVLFTAIGLALVSLGLLIARSPAGAVNPPRWLGWLGLGTGLAYWAAWLVVAAEPFFVFFPISLLGTLILFIGLGGWLITRGSSARVPALTAPVAA
jgi:hypothetical protein